MEVLKIAQESIALNRAVNRLAVKFNLDKSELMQEVLISIWQNNPTYSNLNEFDSYICINAYRKALNMNRNKSRVKDVLNKHVLPLEICLHIEEETERKDILQLFQQTEFSTNYYYSNIFELYLSFKSIKEMSKEVQIPERTIRYNIAKIIEAIKNNL